MQFTTPPLETKVMPSQKVQEKVERVFWFKKEDGEIFCCSESEAWDIMKGRIVVYQDGQKIVKKHEYLGASTSVLYFQGLKEMQKVFREQGQEAAQNYLRELYRKECETADPNIRPRNFDKTLNGIPANF